MKAIIENLKELNPYPESVFTPIKKNELIKVIKLLRDNGYSPDCLYGNWGRTVWNNCVELCKAELESAENELPGKDTKEKLIKCLIFRDDQYYDIFKKPKSIEEHTEVVERYFDFIKDK